MTATIEILSPVPEPPAAAADAAAIRPLPDRVRLALLSNGKPYSGHLLDGVLEVLAADARYRLALREAKPSSSHPAEAAVLNRLMAEADLVVGATAD
jgi:hypothetical protein